MHLKHKRYKNMTTFRDMEDAERKAVVNRLSEVMEKEFEIPWKVGFSQFLLPLN